MPQIKRWWGFLVTNYFVLVLVTLLLGILAIVIVNIMADSSTPKMEFYDFPNRVAVFGVVADRDLQILDISAGSAAERAGVKQGDILKSLDSIPFASPDDAREKIRERLLAPGTDQNSGGTFTLGVSRNGQEVMLEITPASLKGTNPGHGGNLPTATPVPPDQLYF